MKKFISVVLSLFLLTACDSDVKTYDSGTQYYDMLELLLNATNFNTTSTYYDLEAEVSKTDEGYRYYVILDKPKIAMYNIQVMAIVVGDDYSETMAANVGIFEENKYHMIPNQKNIQKGYVEGLSISGITSKNPIEINVIVKYQSKDLADTTRDYYHFEVSYEE